jgi:uncharacterized membrane protein YeaQ/YmgE (transglycosylase-associated protein family)
MIPVLWGRESNGRPPGGGRYGHLREDLMGIVMWIVFGLIAGLLAKFIMPGKDPGGLLITIVLGIVGAVVGGFFGYQMGFGDISGFDARSMALAVGGSLLLLFGYRQYQKA